MSSETVKEYHPHPVFKAMLFQQLNFCCPAPDSIDWIAVVGESSKSKFPEKI